MQTKQTVLLVTGPSGAGRSTAIGALEDIGYEAIDNLPIGLLGRLLKGPATDRPIAVGIDVRTRDFSADALLEAVETLGSMETVELELLYLDCRDDVLLRRYSETRRRHPLAPDETPSAGIAMEFELLAPVRAAAGRLVDTSEMSPHDLRAEIAATYMPEDGTRMAISLQSFSYKRGLPRGLDMVFDCRFLRNPYWDPPLRPLTGLDSRVADYVAGDDRFEPFFTKLCDLARLLLPAYIDEGKGHVSIGFGCTGGQHRSVAVTEGLAKALAQEGWQVSTRHRELESRPGGAAPGARANA